MGNWIVYSKPKQDEKGWHYTRENADGTVELFYSATEQEANEAWWAAVEAHALEEHKPRKRKGR